MTWYNNLNTKLSNSQLNKLRSEKKWCSSNFKCFGDGKTNFPHKLLLTNAQVSEIPKSFTNGSATNTLLLKTQKGTVSRILK